MKLAKRWVIIVRNIVRWEDPIGNLSSRACSQLSSSAGYARFAVCHAFCLVLQWLGHRIRHVDVPAADSGWTYKSYRHHRQILESLVNRGNCATVLTSSNVVTSWLDGGIFNWQSLEYVVIFEYACFSHALVRASEEKSVFYYGSYRTRHDILFSTYLTSPQGRKIIRN
jgi:hypothetical protein